MPRQPVRPLTAVPGAGEALSPTRGLVGSYFSLRWRAFDDSPPTYPWLGYRHIAPPKAITAIVRSDHYRRSLVRWVATRVDTLKAVIPSGGIAGPTGGA